MDKQYSVQFFTSFLENLQSLCRDTIYFNHVVEVSGYVCVEIDNIKKERYVLSELLQSSGGVVSESFCTKAFKTVANFGNTQVSSPRQQMKRQDLVIRRSKENREQRVQNRLQYSPNSRLSQSQTLVPNRSSSESGLFEFITLDGQKEHEPSEVVPSSSLSSSDQKQTSKCASSSSSPKDILTTQSSPRRLSQESTSSCSENYQRLLPSTVDTDTNVMTSVSASTCKEETVKEISATLPDTYPQQMKLETESATSEVDEIIDLDDFDDQFGECQSEFPSFTDEDVPQDDHVVSPRVIPPNFLHYRVTRWPPLKSGSRGTEHVIKYAVNQFKRYHSDKTGSDIDLLSQPPDQLNKLLLDFFKGVRKMDGGLPTASTLRNLQVHLDRYLRDGGYQCSLVKHPSFSECRQYIKSRLEESERCGVPPKYVPVNEEDIEAMFESKQLGPHSCETLSNTMWVLNSKYFNIRRPSDHYNLRWGDIVLNKDDQGLEILQRKLGQFVTLPAAVCAKPENPDRCFVSLFKMFRARRPKMTLEKGFPFYLKFNRNVNDTGFYKPETMTVNQLGSVWRKIANDSGLPVNKKIL